MALTVGGSLMAFGHNKHGALGLGDTQNRFLPQKVSSHSSCFKVDNNCVCQHLWQLLACSCLAEERSKHAVTDVGELPVARFFLTDVSDPKSSTAS